MSGAFPFVEAAPAPGHVGRLATLLLRRTRCTDMADVITGLTDDDIDTTWRSTGPVAEGDDDATDPGTAADDDAADADDDASDSDADQADS